MCRILCDLGLYLNICYLRRLFFLLRKEIYFLLYSQSIYFPYTQLFQWYLVIFAVNTSIPAGKETACKCKKYPLFWKVVSHCLTCADAYSLRYRAVGSLYSLCCLLGQSGALNNPQKLMETVSGLYIGNSFW